tara:strand:+ start:37 stop:648 length:612 start_codon:yes stop_codon:yes gene_type:complete
MIISHKHKFVFIKTRKTAGSTFEKLVYPYLCEKSGDICTGSEQDNTPSMNPKRTIHRGHTPFKRVEDLIDSSYWVFTIERNPWDKVVSNYYFLNSWSGTNSVERSIQEFKNFEVYPNDYLKYESAFGYDFSIFKYEEMDMMYRMLYKKTGIDISKSDVEKTKLKSNFRLVKDYKVMYNGLQYKIQQIGKVFLPEIKLLGYTYD